MNIIEKCNGQIRARTAADGSKERRQPGYKKEDGTSPTVVMDSIIITATIDAHKCQDVTMVNISGAFLHAYNNKDTFMLLCRCLTKPMVQVDPALYRKYVIYGKNDKALLYVNFSKAIYGLLKRALLFYLKFVINLKNYESPFIINSYDPALLMLPPSLDFKWQSLGTLMTSKYHTSNPTKSQNSVNTLHLSMATASWYIKVKSTIALAWTSTLLWMVLFRYQ